MITPEILKQLIASEIIEEVLFESWSRYEEERRKEKESPFDQNDYMRF